MIHIGLSLLTVALESGAAHIGAFPSLMNLVSDEMCKNLFLVRTLRRVQESVAMISEISFVGSPTLFFFI